MWNEQHATGSHNNFKIFNFLQSVTTTGTHELEGDTSAKIMKWCISMVTDIWKNWTVCNGNAFVESKTWRACGKFICLQSDNENKESGQFSRYSDELTGRPPFESRQRQNLFRSTTSRPAIGPPYPMGTAGSFPGDKVAEAWSWPLTSL
jgi:hypothetical protein